MRIVCGDKKYYLIFLICFGFYIFLWNYAIPLVGVKTTLGVKFSRSEINLICHFKNRIERYHVSDLLKSYFI